MSDQDIAAWRAKRTGKKQQKQKPELIVPEDAKCLAELVQSTLAKSRNSPDPVRRIELQKSAAFWFDKAVDDPQNQQAFRRMSERLAVLANAAVEDLLQTHGEDLVALYFTSARPELENSYRVYLEKRAREHVDALKSFHNTRALRGGL